MTIIRPNSISGINSITAKNTDQMKLYDSNGAWSHVRAGVITATTFVGNLTGNVTGTASQLETNATGANLTLSGNLGVAGVLTYEDVARVDAVGLSTFREGFHLGPLAGVGLTAYKDGSIRSTGIITATTFGSDTNSIFTTGGLERLRITSAGNIGIGEDNPTRALHVASDDDLTAFTGGSYGTFAIENSQWDNGDYTAMDFLYNGTAKPVARIASKIASSGSSLHFGVSNNYSTGITHEAMVIDYTGKMGLGVNAPVVKAVISDGYSAPSGGFDSNIVLAVTKNNSSGNHAGIALNGAADGGSFIHFGDTADSNIGRIYYDSSDNMIFYTNNTDRLRINGSDGNVKISNHLAVDKSFEALTGNGVNAKLQVNSGSNDYDGILIGGGYNRSTITTGGTYDLVYTSNAYPANATSKGHRFLCGTSGGGGPNQRMRIHQWGGIESDQNFNGANAFRYFWTFGANGTYNTCNIDLGFLTNGGFNLEYMLGGYNNKRKHFTYQGYNYNNGLYGGGGAIQSGNGPQTALTAIATYGSYGTKVRLACTSLSVTHPNIRLDVSSTFGGVDVVAVSWS